MSPAQPDEAARLQRLAYLRDEVFECDQDMVRIVGLRRRLVDEIGEIKADLGLPTSDPQRDAAVVKRAVTLAEEADVDRDLVGDLMERVVASARTLAAGGVRAASKSDES